MSDETVNVTPVGKNRLLVEAPKTRRIKTIDQLSEAGQVDKKVWEIERFKLNKWEVAAKDADSILQVEELFQVTGWYRRIKLVAVAPTIQPLTVDRISVTYNTPKYRQPKGIQKALILPDPHFGYKRDLVSGELTPLHDMRAIDIALQVAWDFKPHYIVALGDILDLAEWSDKFPRSPEFQQTTQPALIAANWWLSNLSEAATGAVKVVLEGNHDKRLELALINHLKAAFDLRPVDELELPPALSIPRLLALHDIGWQYAPDYPSGEFWLTDELLCIHGDIARKGGGKTTAELVKAYDVNTIAGHIHRVEQSPRTRFDGRGSTIIGAYSPGCLCHVDGRVPGRKKRQDWQQGFGVAYFGEGIEPSVQLYPIKDGRCLFGGQLYIGEDRTEVLKQASGWPF